MEYDKERKGIACVRDCFGEHFSSEIKNNYMICVYGEVVTESESPDALVIELEGIIEGLTKWKNHFKRFKKNNN